MKAVLEFNYPEDEDRLRYALHGGKAIQALGELSQQIRLWEKHGGDPEQLIERLKANIHETMAQCGED